ncbi:MAG: phosphatase PAP2 family protein [Bacteroidales bacterium]|nr:phosphatase PAP2 family protein [Bacteroidales bacterium]
MIDTLIDTDTTVFLWLNSWHHPFWDTFMYIASGRLTWVGLYTALILALLRAYGWRTMAIVFLASILAVTLADQFTATILRPFVERLRPAHLENPISSLVHVVNDYRGGRYGFPSCHAANTFALCTVMALVFRRPALTVAMIVWAVLNCYSRIYLGVHYPGDILAGTIIGIICGTITYLLARIAISLWPSATPTGRTDALRHADIGGLRFTYREAHIPIAALTATILYLLCLAA